MKRLTAIALTAMLFLCACAPTSGPPPMREADASAPDEPPVLESSAQPTAPPPDAAVLLREAALPSLPEVSFYPRDGELNGQALISAHPEITLALYDAFSAWESAAAQQVSDALGAYYKDRWGGCTTALPTWQMVAAAAVNCEAPEQLADAFLGLITPGLHITVSDTETYRLELEVKSPREVFALSSVKGDPIPTEFFTYTYLMTVYDEAMQPIENSGQEPALAEVLTFPFAERYEYRDGWYNDRDGGARRHTGTDISCPEGTPELAVVDGLILAVGNGEGTGNYVVLEGADGTQYHYYHMVELSALVSPGDTVKRGDPVGLVGNTGNSTANHLHLAIIAPSGVYVNPFEYLNNAL